MQIKNSDMDNCKIIICGGRHFNNYSMLKYIVDDVINGIPTNEIEIVSGHCEGTDILGERYAKENNYALKIFPAEWKKYGKSAGPIRNKQMIDYIKSSSANPIVVAFKSKNSKGTENTISHARKSGISVYEISYEVDTVTFTLYKSDFEIISEGVNFNNGNFVYNWEEDTNEDIIKLDTLYHCHSKSFSKNIRYYGYKINKTNDNANARKNFLKYIKSPEGIEDTSVKKLVYQCIKDFVDRYNVNIRYVVKMASSSQFVDMVFNEYEKIANNCVLISTSKISPDSFEVDWEYFNKDNKNKPIEYYDKFKKYLEKLFEKEKSKYQKNGYVSISSIPTQYRKYIKNIFKFDDIDINLNNISSLLIIDDTFTEGFSFSKIIELLQNYGYNGDISVLSIFDNA